MIQLLARKFLSVSLCGAILVALALPTISRAADEDFSTVTDEAVHRAIADGVRYIKSQRHGNNWERQQADATDRFYGGTTGLALLALLYAGEDPREPEMSAALDWLSAQTLTGTYSIGIRAHVFALVPGEKFRLRLKNDLGWIVTAQLPKESGAPGAFTYINDHGAGYDNSNSQYGVLGAWMASESGVKPPDEFWQLVEEHWIRDQTPEGGWGYGRGTPTGSMTAAGLATMFVILDILYSRDFGNFDGKATPKCGVYRGNARIVGSITRALGWFTTVFDLENPKGSSAWQFYYLYGVERVGRASGKKYFGDKDWFRLGARFLLAAQKKDGDWSPAGGSNNDMNDLHNTCFGVMFLCHGRAPLLFSKLDYSADSTNKLRDVAGLCRYAQGSFERLLNWQTVTLGGKFEDWLEAPVLYMTGHNAPKFGDADIQRLREYCLRGGMVLGVACCSRAEFTQGFRDIAKKAFPDFPLRELPAKHPLFNGEVDFGIDNPPQIFEVNNGNRTLMLLCPTDISAAWHQYLLDKYEPYIQLGCNIYLYATDKSAFTSRLVTPEIAPKNTKIRQTVALARIAYEGNWDIEAFGWSRLTRTLSNEAGTKVLVTSGVKLNELNPEEFKVAYLTGNKSFELSKEEIDGLRKFINNGGTLLADAANSSPEFLRSFETHLTTVMRGQPTNIAEDSGIVTGQGIPDGASLKNITFRRAARQVAAGQTYPRLRGFKLGKRWAVIYSPMDVSCGLLGTPIYNCKGFAPESALQIARNMILYAALPSSEKAKLDQPSK